MFIPFGELGLGKLSESQKKNFISFVGSQLDDDEKVEPFKESQMIRKSVDWNIINNIASTATIIGFIYKAGKSAPKTLRNFFEFSKNWAKKNNIEYDEKQIADWVEFMEKDNSG